MRATKETTASLDASIAELKKHPELIVEISGHTDSIETESYNKSLSLHRARAAYGYLIKHGVNKSQLRGPVGYGEGRFISPNRDADGFDYPEGRAKNRRVELDVI